MSALTPKADIQRLAQNYIFDIWRDVRFRGQSGRNSECGLMSANSQKRTFERPLTLRYPRKSGVRKSPSEAPISSPEFLRIKGSTLGATEEDAFAYIVKIGVKVARHGRDVTFQMIGVTVPRGHFRIHARQGNSRAKIA